MILMVKKLLKYFMEKNCERLIKKNSEQERRLKEKVINCMSNGKLTIICLIVGLIKKICCDSRFALKTILANLKTEVEKLDIDKLVPVPVDLSKISDVVKTDVIKKND